MRNSLAITLLLILVLTAYQSFSVVGGSELPQGNPLFYSVAQIEFQMMNEAGTSRSNYGCTGVLIAKNKILTAAHCVSDEDLASYWVKFYDPRNPTSFIKQVEIVATSRNRDRISEGNLPDAEKDMAVLTLKESLSSPFRVLPVAGVNSNVLINTGDSLEIIGAGSEIQTDTGAYTQSRTLKRAEVSVLRSAELESRIRTLEMLTNASQRPSANALRLYEIELDLYKDIKNVLSSRVTRERFLILQENYDSGIALQGDSGGPVLKSTREGYVVVGTVSIILPTTVFRLRNSYRPDFAIVTATRTANPLNHQFLNRALNSTGEAR